MNKEKALEKVDELMTLCNQALKTKKQSYSGFYSGKYFIDKNLFTKCLTDINQFLNSHQSFRHHLREFKNIRPLTIHTNYDMVKKYLNFLENLKNDIEKDSFDFDDKKKSPKTNPPSSETSFKNYGFSEADVFSNSINTIQNISIFEKLTEAIQNNSNIKNQDKLLELVQKMERNQHYKPAYIKNYQEFMSLAADNMTVIAPFIPDLTRFLS